MAAGDYDLVVIGQGERAIALALKAKQLKARVALVTTDKLWNRAQVEAIIHKVRLTPHLLFQTLQSRSPFEDLVFLQSSGVDVILGEGQFSDRHTFLVNLANSQNQSKNPQFNTRKLSSAQFAIVRDVLRPVPKIMGLNEIAYLTYDSLFNLLKSSNLEASLESSESWAASLSVLRIFGGDSLSCAIAQLLNTLGVKVQILTKSHILPELDLDTARILQTHLEIQGIEILTECEVTAVSDLQIWITTPSGSITLSRMPSSGWADSSEQILIPIFDRDRELNFAIAGIKVKDDEILINSKLQTTNPHIYLCHELGNIDFILKNSLFWGIANVKPSIPSALCLTNPVVSSIGENEIDARLHFGRDLYVLQSPAQTDDLGFYKVLYRGNGEIVGAHFVGDLAQELLASMSIIMNKKLKVSDLKGIEVGAIAELCQAISTNIWAKNWRSFWFKLFS